MPLLYRRRSTLDLLLNDVRNNARDEDASRQSRTPAGSPALSATPNMRPATAQPAQPAPRGMSEDIHRPPIDRADTPPMQDPTPATRRFSMLRWRHFSDSSLAATARMHAGQEERPPVPDFPSQTTAPAIITTAPTMELSDQHPPKKQRTPFKRQMSKLTSPSKHLLVNNNSEKQSRQSAEHNEGAKHLPPWRKSFEKKDRRDQLQRTTTAGSTSRGQPAPPPYGDESTSALALPVERLSVSSSGDRSSSEQVTYATTTTTHTISTTTTLFKLPRRNKRKSLFPLPAKPAHSPDSTHTDANTISNAAPNPPRASTSALSTSSNIESPARLGHSPYALLHRRHTEASRPRILPSPSVSPSRRSLARSNTPSMGPPGLPLLRNESINSAHSAHSSPTLAPPRHFGFRDRSSTMSSFGRPSDDTTPPTPPNLASARNSTSTSGRTSLGGFLSLNRFRHGSESQARNSSPGTRSKSNSFALSREALVVPEREEGDTPGKYLERLQATVSRSLIAGILSKSADPFAQAVLRSYSRKFPFFGEPIDMSLRKFLLEAELPKETQQVDRVIQAFADRYHECNPGIFQSPDKAYIVAFSLMMLHTDAFNKNNKRKMQKQDYVKNTSGQNVSDDILACFYDNICYTPFIHFDEEVDINGERLLSFKPKKSKLRATIPDPVRKTSGPIDPYALICEGKLDVLRPNIKEAINTDDPYTYLGTAGTLDIKRLQRAFVNTGILQIISARSRPAAFESQATRDNPNDAAAGVVDLKITKIGVLWRKSTKRKKTRSPWQEWGAILTGSQLYLFKNLAWIKGLMTQQQMHNKQGTSFPCIFNPPISDFKPDALIKTDDAVALLDAGYLRHKDAFTLVRHGGQEEVLLAENEAEMNEWIALINYAAAFRSAGVRIRGFIGGSESDPITRSKGRLDSSASVASITRPESEGAPKKQTMAPELVQQVLLLRGQIMRQTIVESEREIEQMTNSLETMLRNARHLLLLAPIQQKTRDDVIHAASRMNAMLKWVRRDIWRMKCHRDILARDLELDNGMCEKSAPSQATSPPVVAINKAGPQRLGSRKSSLQSPTLSPQSPQFRPDHRSSVEDFFGKDVFKTPPEHARRLDTSDDWKMPPLDLNTDHTTHRLSVTSAGQSLLRKHSVAGMSTSSSAFDRQHSYAGSDAPSRPGLDKSSASFDDREQEALMLARDDLAPTNTVNTASSGGGPQPYDLASVPATPESNSKPKNRRSLHRTLRDAREHPSINRHRRGKESASTVRSDTSRTGEPSSDVAPVLERSTGKFIVHGKKASVITFGGDWTEEKMRLKREVEARTHALGTAIDTDESGPEANLRRHMELELSASGEVDDFTSDDTAPIPHRNPSDHNEGVSPEDAEHPRSPNAAATTPSTLKDEARSRDVITLGSQNEPLSSHTLHEAVDSYFDAGNAQPSNASEGQKSPGLFTQPVFPPPIEASSKTAHEDIDGIAPEQLPLPLSPPPVETKYDHGPPDFTKYIADDELRQLSQTKESDDVVGDQHRHSAQVVGA